MKKTYVSRLNLLEQKICTGIVAKKKKDSDEVSSWIQLTQQ